MTKGKGPSSRTTGGELVFTVSAYGCVPAPGGQLCPAGDARVGARSVLDCNTGLICGASCTQPHEGGQRILKQR